MTLDKAIITVEEASNRVRGQVTADLALAIQLIVGGTEEIETILRRKVVSRGPITEYHSFYRGTCDLWLNQFPVLTVTSIHEDSDRDYAAADLLVANTDYLVDLPSGKVIRIEGDSETSWLTGLEAVKVVYTAGYTQANVPDDIKQIALELFELQWREAMGGRAGRSSVSDDMGSSSFFGPAELTSHMKRRLIRHEKAHFPNGTFSRSSTA